jgi:peptidoglycan hydrolase-like protein with peptidoglycan-binding domain
MPGFSRGITIRTTRTTITHTITYTDVPGDNTGAAYNDVPVADPTVQDVQAELTQLGYYSGPVDGFFGPTTRDAVAKYQIAKNLSVTGSLSPDMLQSLGLPQATGS